MEFFQTLGLFPEFLRCRDDYHHVGRAVGVQILVGYVIHVLRNGERRGEVGSGKRLVPRHGHIVEARRSAREHGYFYLVLRLWIIYSVSARSLIAFVVCRKADVESA